VRPAIDAAAVRAVRCTVARILSNADDREDAAQTALLNALEGFASYSPDRPFLAWLRRIAINAAFDVLRSHARERVGVARALDCGRVTCSVPSPEGAAEAREEWAVARAALSPRRAAAVELMVAGHDREEIGREMGIAPTTVSVFVHAARRTMRAAVGGR